MIAHVAQAGEQRGRVVLQVSCRHPNPIALAAALWVAQAFQSEIESLFVEDDQIFDAVGFSFVRQVSFDGRRRAALSRDGLEAEMRLAAAAVARQMAGLARVAEVPVRQTIVRGEAVSALARACEANGPWNVVALSEPVGTGGGAVLRAVFDTVAGTTGVVVVSPAARRTSGPVIAVVEDIGHLEQMLRWAQRLLGVTDPPGGTADMVLLLVSSEAEQGVWMEAQARLALGPEIAANIRLAALAYRSSDELAEIVRRLAGGFVIGQFGGLLAPADGDLRHLVHALECPLFLMR